MTYQHIWKMPLLIVASLVISLMGAASAQEKITIGLVNKTNNNPFFVKMREGAEAKSAELGVELRSFAGRYDGDNDTQIDAIETLISIGAQGFMIVPSDSKGIVPALQKARDAGMFVITLDTPTDPMDAADITFATDNREAGRLIGRWAAGILGEAAADAKIAFINGLENQPAADMLRNQGFMEGFGIDIKDPNRYGEEDDPRIVGHRWGQGAEDGGRTGMEQLLQREPAINVVYTINEPTAAGAYEAIKAVRREGDVLLVSVDGGCPGVRNVAEGVLGATAQQYPLLMTSLGVEALVRYIKTGEKPLPSEGLDFFNTGVRLVTDKPVAGVPSISSAEALNLCWG